MRRYYYAGAQRIAMRTGTDLKFLLGDHLGSTSVTALASGAFDTETRYYPWGGVRWASGTTPTDYRFTGQQEIATIGLYFYNSRFYDAYLNRWIQPDTIIPDPTYPLDWDRFVYSRNNPVKYTDPTGHCVELEGENNGLCVRRNHQGAVIQIVRGGSYFVNYYEIGLANYILTQDNKYLDALPSGVASGNAYRSTVAASAGLGYRDLEGLALFDLLLNPMTAVALGTAGGQLFEDLAYSAYDLLSTRLYIRGLEGGNPQAHAWSKHGPIASNQYLSERSLNSSRAQTKFASPIEMRSAIEITLSANESEIRSLASGSEPGFKQFYGPVVGYNGYQNGLPITGNAPVTVIVWYDGKGNWGLFTAYPRP
jgi:RHS repeat-associated protein